MAKAKPLISIVDDDESMREALKGLMKSLGHRVEAAASAEEFLRSPHICRTSCLIADVQMPGMTGLQLCRAVKDSAFSSVKIIVYTAGMASREDSMSAGCDGYFLKTDPLPNLRDAVRHFYALA